MENAKERITKKITKMALHVAVAASLATGADSVAAQSGRPSHGLEKYGKIVLYNANLEEGGTRGHGGIVQDPSTGKVLLCSVRHVTEGGPIMEGIFTPQSDGDDPIVCTELSPSQVGIERGEISENIPKISAEILEVGNTVSMLDADRHPRDFTVSEIEDGRVWFTSEHDTGEWEPSGGDSGSMVAITSGEEVKAVGFYGGRAVVPNRDNPAQPIVKFYMIPFSEEYFR